METYLVPLVQNPFNSGLPEKSIVLSVEPIERMFSYDIYTNSISISNIIFKIDEIDRKFIVFRALAEYLFDTAMLSYERTGYDFSAYGQDLSDCVAKRYRIIAYSVIDRLLEEYDSEDIKTSISNLVSDNIIPYEEKYIYFDVIDLFYYGPGWVVSNMKDITNSPCTLTKINSMFKLIEDSIFGAKHIVL